MSNSLSITFFVPVQNDVVNALSFLNVRFECSLLTFKMMRLLVDLISLYCNLAGFMIFEHFPLLPC